MVNPNLLEISITNAKLQYNINPGQLQNPHAPKPLGIVSTDRGGVEVQYDMGAVNIDTYAARSSMGYGEYNIGDFIKVEVQKGISRGEQATRALVQKGNALQDRIRPSDLARQNTQSKFRSDTTTVWYPSENADIQIDKAVTDVNVRKGSVQIDWQNTEIVPLDFVRGSVTFEMIENPDVTIEYTGDWNYFPPLDIKV